MAAYVDYADRQRGQTGAFMRNRVEPYDLAEAPMSHSTKAAAKM